MAARLDLATLADRVRPWPAVKIELSVHRAAIRVVNYQICLPVI